MKHNLLYQSAGPVSTLPVQTAPPARPGSAAPWGGAWARTVGKAYTCDMSN